MIRAAGMIHFVQLLPSHILSLLLLWSRWRRWCDLTGPGCTQPDPWADHHPVNLGNKKWLNKWMDGWMDGWAIFLLLLYLHEHPKSIRPTTDIKNMIKNRLYNRHHASLILPPEKEEDCDNFNALDGMMFITPSGSGVCRGLDRSTNRPSDQLLILLPKIGKNLRWPSFCNKSWWVSVAAAVATNDPDHRDDATHHSSRKLYTSSVFLFSLSLLSRVIYSINLIYVLSSSPFSLISFSWSGYIISLTPHKTWTPHHRHISNSRSSSRKAKVEYPSLASRC